MGSDGFDNPLTGGEGALIYPRIKSPDFQAGMSGWSIERDGTAEFNDVVIRGEVNVRDPDTGSYVRIWNQNPGDGAVIEIRPGDSVGAVDAPAYIATGTDPVFGAGGLSISGPSINGSGIPSIVMNEIGVFYEASQGIHYFTSDSGFLISGPGDFEILDALGNIDVQYNPNSAIFSVGLFESDFADLNSGSQPGGALTAVRVFDTFYGPNPQQSTSSTSFSNIPNSTGITFSKGYNGTDVKLTLMGKLRASAVGVQAAIAVSINGVDYECDRQYFDIANYHAAMGGFAIVPAASLPAGTYTVRARWRYIAGGPGNVIVDNFDRFSLEAREVKG